MGRSLWIFLTIFFIQLPVIGSESQSKSIEDLLKMGIKSCHDNFEGEKPEKYVFDKANAYAHVSGGYPTCGCPCSATSTVFVGGKGEYFQWTFETDHCSQIYKMSSNTKVKSLLPEGMLSEFGVTPNQDFRFATFYLKPELPRKGTKVRLSIAVIPVGIKEDCNGPVCISLIGGTFKRKVKWVDYIQSWLNQPEARDFAKQYLEKLKIPNDIPLAFLNYGKKMGRNNLDKKTVIEDLKFVRDVFQQSQALKFDKIDLYWNKKKNRFEINKKFPYKKKSFKEFIQNQEFETPKC